MTTTKGNPIDYTMDWYGDGSTHVELLEDGSNDETFAYAFTAEGDHLANLTAFNLHSFEEIGGIVGFVHNITRMVHVLLMVDDWDVVPEKFWIRDDGGTSVNSALNLAAALKLTFILSLRLSNVLVLEHPSPDSVRDVAYLRLRGRRGSRERQLHPCRSLLEQPHLPHGRRIHRLMPNLQQSLQ